MTGMFLRQGLVAILAVAALAVFASRPAWAPANDQPEQISAVQPVWDKPGQRFNLPLTAQLAVGKPATGVFRLEATITVSAGGKGFNLKASQAFQVISVDGANRARVRPPVLPWDRNGGAVKGPVKVAGTVVLLDPRGRKVDSASFSGQVEVG